MAGCPGAMVAHRRHGCGARWARIRFGVVSICLFSIAAILGAPRTGKNSADLAKSPKKSDSNPQVDLRTTLISRVKPKDRKKYKNEVDLNFPVSTKDPKENYPYYVAYPGDREFILKTINDAKLQNCYLRRDYRDTKLRRRWNPTKKKKLHGPQWKLANLLLTYKYLKDDPVVGIKSGRVAGCVKRIVKGKPMLVPWFSLRGLEYDRVKRKVRVRQNREAREKRLREKEKGHERLISRRDYRLKLLKANISTELGQHQANVVFNAHLGSDIHKFGKALAMLKAKYNFTGNGKGVAQRKKKQKILRELQKNFISTSNKIPPIWEGSLEINESTIKQAYLRKLNVKLASRPELILRRPVSDASAWQDDSVPLENEELGGEPMVLEEMDSEEETMEDQDGVDMEGDYNDADDDGEEDDDDANENQAGEAWGEADEDKEADNDDDTADYGESDENDEDGVEDDDDAE
ncbi:hypothetical protein AAMO2058_001317900 [Amorphochlora amoebiformis]